MFSNAYFLLWRRLIINRLEISVFVKNLLNRRYSFGCANKLRCFLIVMYDFVHILLHLSILFLLFRIFIFNEAAIHCRLNNAIE